ncbi:hypothetical protein V1504DRAFT_479176 [Lipomyces starkeyi]
MSMLCSAISRSALELIHTEVMKKIHRQEEPGTMDKCNCATRIRYLCLARIRYNLVCRFKLRKFTLGGEFKLREKVAQEELEDSQHLPRLCNGQPIGQKGCDGVDPAEGLDTLGAPVLYLIQVEQPQDVDIGTGKEDDPPKANDEDGSTLEEMSTDILSTIEQVNGNDGSEHAK